MRLLFIAICIVIAVPGAFAAPRQDCYSGITYMQAPSQKAARALYILVDQTVPLSQSMRQKVSALLESWGRPGDLIKIVRFSNNTKGRYPEYMFNGFIAKSPDEFYWYNLRDSDRSSLKVCVEQTEKAFYDNFHYKLRETLNTLDPTIAKTEILLTLKEISKVLINPDDAETHTVLFISDGLENSNALTFYKKGRVKKIDVRTLIGKVRREGLIGYWQGASIYAYGLGLPKTDKVEIKSEVLTQLRSFWEQYFVEGGGSIKVLGAPELLVTEIE